MSTTATTDHQLVDRIAYLGSLASDQRAVDPMLDTLRYITSKWSAGAPLGKEDRASLVILETKLKNYLLHKDPLRSFTTKSLEDRLTAQARSSHAGLDRTIRDFVIVLLLTIGSGGAVLVSPIGFPESTRLVAAFPISLLTLHLGIVWFYLTSLRNFNRQFREAFMYLCVGILWFGVLVTAFTLVQVFELTKYPAFKYGEYGAIGLLSYGCLYLGLRKYASLLQIKSRCMSLKFLGSVVLVSDLVLAIVPHIAKVPPSDELYLRFSLITLLPCFIFAAFGAMLARQIMHRVTPAYVTSIRILFFYMLSFMIVAPTGIGYVFIFGALQGNSLNTYMLFTSLPIQTILLYSGFIFKRETGR
jgi:hypothetical protein